MGVILTFIIFIVSEIFALIAGVLGLILLFTVGFFNTLYMVFENYPLVSLSVLGFVMFFVYQKSKS